MAIETVRVQGNLNDTSSGIIRAMAAAKGESNSGLAILLLERFLESPEALEQLRMTIMWASPENREKAISELRKLNEKLPATLGISE